MTPPSSPRSWRRATTAALLAVPLLLAAVNCGSGSDSGPVLTGQAKTGQDLAKAKGCLSCHTVNGSRSEGPTWKGLSGSTVTLKDGSTVVADDAYLARSMTEPGAQIVKGYSNLMPRVQLSDAEVAALTAYIVALK